MNEAGLRAAAAGGHTGRPPKEQKGAVARWGDRGLWKQQPEIALICKTDDFSVDSVL